MKAYGVPIQVQAQNGQLISLEWRRRTCRVNRILDRWILQSRWWEREEKRCYYLLHTDLGEMEIYRSGAGWVLSRVLD
ncbi:MAG: hypothetical protein ABIL09_06220 [Gemmatimonadota bacterium]